MRLTPEDVLLVVDVQNDFVTGTLAVPGALSIVAPINRLIEKFEHVVFAQDWHPPGHVSFLSAHPGAKHGEMVKVAYGMQRVAHDHCLQGSSGAQFHPELTVDKAELILRKGYRKDVDSNSAFYENDRITKTGLSEYLRARGFKRVSCVGLVRYGCVKRSAEDAVSDGFEVVMFDDACKGPDLGGAADDAAARQLAEVGVKRGLSHSVEARGARL